MLGSCTHWYGGIYLVTYFLTSVTASHIFCVLHLFYMSDKKYSRSVMFVEYCNSVKNSKVPNPILLK